MSFNELYPSIFHIKFLSARTNKNHWLHLPRCNLQSVIRNHAAAPAIPPSRAPINSPAAAPACRCVRSRSIAFQGTHPSRGHALDSSSVSLTEATLRKLAAAVHGVPFTFFLECRCEETRNDTFKMIKTRVPATARPGSTERLRRTGAAPALRVYRRLKACISPGRPGWSMAGWHGVRELDT